MGRCEMRNAIAKTTVALAVLAFAKEGAINHVGDIQTSGDKMIDNLIDGFFNAYFQKLCDHGAPTRRLQAGRGRGMKRTGLQPLAPIATLKNTQGEEITYENTNYGEGNLECRDLWFHLRQRAGYIPQFQALPWAFGQKSTLKEQERSLQVHAEKKALSALLARGETHLSVAINFNACMDCHEWFKALSLLMGRGIQIKQPKLSQSHFFVNGKCSCNDRWRWEARIRPALTEEAIFLNKEESSLSEAAFD